MKTQSLQNKHERIVAAYCTVVVTMAHYVRLQKLMYFRYAAWRMTQVTDQAGFTTTKILNDMGLPLNVTYPDGSAEANEYDTFGNLKKNVDPMGRQTNVTYNENNQPLTVTDALGNVTTYEYDGDFNLKKVTDALGAAVSMTYDSRGNMLTQADPAGRVTIYTYDTFNRPKTVARKNRDRHRF